MQRRTKEKALIMRLFPSAESFHNLGPNNEKKECLTSQKADKLVEATK